MSIVVYACEQQSWVSDVTVLVQQHASGSTLASIACRSSTRERLVLAQSQQPLARRQRSDFAVLKKDL